jgi:hypothetical protein
MSFLLCPYISLIIAQGTGSARFGVKNGHGNERVQGVEGRTRGPASGTELAVAPGRQQFSLFHKLFGRENIALNRSHQPWRVTASHPEKLVTEANLSDLEKRGQDLFSPSKASFVRGLLLKPPKRPLPPFPQPDHDAKFLV